MLERIREGSQGVVAKGILFLVIITFALSGISSYINSQADLTVAEVNGVEIGESELEQAFQNERSRMQAQFGDMIDQLMSDESYVANMRAGILERLVVEEIQKQQAKDMGVRVGDDQIKDAIRKMPEFQEAGRFNNDIYIARLRQAGYTPAQFRDYLRQQMARTQFSGAIFGSEFVLPSEKTAFGRLNGQTRSFQLAKVEAKALQAEITPEQSDLDNYYQLNQSRYQTQEKVAVEYIVIDSNEMQSQVEVSDEEVAQYYEENKASYTVTEKRRISHILVEEGEGAETKIAEVAAKLEAGESFESLAKTYSDDTFSGENGGDLEYFDVGIFGDDFDAAVLSLSTVGQVTEAIETESGTHFIKLTELEPAVVSALDEVKEEISATLREDKVRELYIDAQTQVTQISYELSDSLVEVAKEVSLTMQTAPLSNRGQFTGDLAQPAVLNQLFDADFIEQGFNSDLIELSGDKSIVVRVSEHEPARQQSLDEVKTFVEAAVKQDKAAELAQSRAQEALEKLKSGSDFATVTSELGLTSEAHSQIGRTDSSIERNVRNGVFTMPKPVDGKSEFDVIAAANGDSYIVALNAVQVEEVENDAESNQLAAILSRIATKALVDASKSNASVTF